MQAKERLSAEEERRRTGHERQWQGLRTSKIHPPPSQLRTKLVWEGKYDEYGNWREGDAGGLALPMQEIETIDQPSSKAAAAGQLGMFEKKTITDPKDVQQNLVVWINGLGALMEAGQ